MIRKAIPLLSLALVTACSSKDAELDQFIAEVKQEQPGGIEPLPEIRLPDTFPYAAQYLRSPFVQGGSGASSGQGPRPNSTRNKQYLEQFSLDSLKMKGTLGRGGRATHALIQTSDGIVHRVQTGQYVGQNEGRVVSIEPSRINIIEIVPDQLGGYMERPATLQLAE